MRVGASIFGRYLTSDLPIDPDMVETIGGGDPDKAVQAMIEDTVREMYRDDEANRFLEVTYQNGDKEVMYFKDFSSGAMIETSCADQETRHQAADRRRPQGHPYRRPPFLDPSGVQGARGSAEHDQSRRLGEDFGQEG